MANKHPNYSKLTTKGGYKRTITDPRVHLFKQYYIDPKSETFMNIFQSGMKAGYSEQYSTNISVQKPAWWVEFTGQADVRRARMLNKAENNIESVLDAPDATIDDKKMKLQASTFVSERLGKDFYSSRQELTDKGGRRLIPSDSRVNASIPLVSLFKGVKEGE